MVAYLVKAAGMQLRTQIVRDDGHDDRLAEEALAAMRRRAAEELLRCWLGNAVEPKPSAIDRVEAWLARHESAVGDLDSLSAQDRKELVGLLESADR